MTEPKTLAEQWQEVGNFLRDFGRELIKVTRLEQIARWIDRRLTP